MTLAGGIYAAAFLIAGYRLARYAIHGERVHVGRW